MSSASSQAQGQVDGAHLLHTVVLQFSVHHLAALVDQPLLALRDPLGLLHPHPEVLHGFIRSDVEGLRLALLIFEEHLDGGGPGDQQGNPRPGAQVVGAQGPGVVPQRDPLAVIIDQPLGLCWLPQPVLDAALQGTHGVLRAHSQRVGRPVQHSDEDLHDLNLK